MRDNTNVEYWLDTAKLDRGDIPSAVRVTVSNRPGMVTVTYSDGWSTDLAFANLVKNYTRVRQVSQSVSWGGSAFRPVEENQDV